MARSESIASLFVELRGTIDKFVAEMDKASRAVAKTGRKLKSIGSDLSVAVTAPLAGIATAALTAATQFDAAMNKMVAKADVTGKEFKQLEDQALELGKQTVFSARQVAEGMAELAGAGFKAADIGKAIPGVLDLAAASGMRVAEAAEVAGNVLNAFRMRMEESVRVANVLAKADAESNVSLRDLAYTMKYAAPNAKLAGIAFEEVAAAAALMGNAGIKAETAGTTLRMGLKRLLSPPKQARTALEELGVTLEQLKNQDGTLKPLVEIVGILGEKGAKAEHVFKIFGAEAASGFAVLLNQGAPALAQMTQKLLESDGEAKKMADTLMRGLPGAWERMKGAVETAAIALGKALTPAAVAVLGVVERLADKATELAQWFQTLSPETQNWAIGLLAVATAAGPVLVTIGGIVAAVSALLSPTLLVTSAVVGLGAALGTFLATNETASAVISATWNAIKYVVSETVEAVSGLLVSLMFLLKGEFANAWHTIDRLIGDAVRNIYHGVKEWLYDKLTAVFDAVKENVYAVGGWFQDLYQSVVGGSYVPDLIDGIEAQFGRLDDVMTAPVLRETRATAQAFAGMAQSVSGAFGNLFSGLGVGGKFGGFLGDVMGALVGGGKGKGAGGQLGSLLANALFGGQGFLPSLNSLLGFGRPEGVQGPLLPDGTFTPGAGVTEYVGPVLDTIDAIGQLGKTTEDTVAGMTEVAGTALGAIIGGPAGAGIGNQVGSFAGKFLGGLFGGGKPHPDTAARGTVEKWLNEALQGKGFGTFSFGGSGAFNKPGWADGMRKFGDEAVMVFSALGEAVRRNLGIAQDIGPQIGFMLANHLNGNVAEAGRLMSELGLTAESMGQQILEAGVRAGKPWLEIEGQLAGLDIAMGQTAKGAGTLAEAFAHVTGSQGVGMGPLDALRKMAEIAEKLGAKTLEDMKRMMLSQGAGTPQQIEQIFQAMDMRGVTTLDALKNAGDRTLGAMIADVTAMGFEWDKVAQSVERTTAAVQGLGQAMGATGLPSAPAGSGVPAFASGGVVSRPTMALMGEAGPEAILPLTRVGGQLGVRAQVGGGGGGMVVNVYAPNAEPGMEQKIMRAIRDMGETAVSQAVQAVYDQRSRPKGYGDAFDR